MRIAYCDHSFHKKTTSTQFLSEIILRRTGHRVDYFWDESWEGGSPVRFGQVEHYDIIVLFQTIPINLPRCIAQVHSNVIFVPMLDQLGIARGPLFNLKDFWRPFRGSKVLSFSTAVNAMAISNGVASEYFQYMPSLLGLDDKTTVRGSENNRLRVFYWVRRPSDISATCINRLLSQIKEGYVIHLHLSPDPGQKQMTDDEAVNAFAEANCASITISRWLNTKSELLKLVKNSDIFLAPRLEEGIGQVFLEALSCGLCIVAPNNGTMNEYLVHGVNGLLYNPDCPEPLVFDEIDAIRQNALRTAKSLSGQWQADEDRLIDYIMKPSFECYASEHKYCGIQKGKGFDWQRASERVFMRARRMLGPHK
jgi:glycosyltransferase involved in cell wall biosynthesis